RLGPRRPLRRPARRAARRQAHRPAVVLPARQPPQGPSQGPALAPDRARGRADLPQPALGFRETGKLPARRWAHLRPDRVARQRSAGRMTSMSRPAPLRIGSLCSGYGALDLAVTAVLDAGLAWCAETAPHASAVLAARWPGVPNLGDITAVDWAAVPPV